MGKIYYGKRGCGKTVRLLRQAEALYDDGLIPVIICVHTTFIETLKETAKNRNIDYSRFVFLSFADIKKEANAHYLKDKNCRILIDELTYFVQDILGIRNNGGFYATLSSEDCRELHRSDWDPSYIETGHEDEE